MRLICGIESTDTSFGKVRWFSDTFEVFELSEGRLLKTLNLPSADSAE